MFKRHNHKSRQSASLVHGTATHLQTTHFICHSHISLWCSYRKERRSLYPRTPNQRCSMPKIHDKDILRPTRKILQFTALQRNLPLLLIVPHTTLHPLHRFPPTSNTSNTYTARSALHTRPTSLSGPSNRMRHIRPAIIPLVLRLVQKQYKLWWMRNVGRRSTNN